MFENKSNIETVIYVDNLKKIALHTKEFYLDQINKNL